MSTGHGFNHEVVLMMFWKVGFVMFVVKIATTTTGAAAETSSLSLMHTLPPQ